MRKLLLAVMACTTTTTLALAVSAPAAHATSNDNRLPRAVDVAPQGPGGVRTPTGAAAQAHSWMQQAKLSGASSALFGWSVAVSGSTMVVSAPSDNANIGAAYVYSGAGGTWTLVATLTPSDGLSGDFFGSSVAITPGTIVVGAEGRSSSEGLAYVFSGGGAFWKLQTELSDPGGAANDFFGAAVAALPSTITVAAAGDNSNRGAVYSYGMIGGTWVEKAKLSDPVGVANDSFGFGLAANKKTLVVGAPGTNGFTGAVYVYSPIRGGWIRRATLASSNGRGCLTTCGAGYGLIGGDYFGYSVSLNGTTLAVGSPFASVPPAQDGVGQGVSYVFRGQRSSWTQATELYVPAETGAAEWFGFNVAVSQSGSIAVNAPYDPLGVANGATFVFPRHGGTWTSPSKLTASDGAPGDYFGWQGLATIGTKYVAVGSPYSPNGGVYLFQG